jgi:cell division protein FtsL
VLIRTKINIALGLLIIVFSILNIIWNHQSRILYKESMNVKTNNHRIISIHKQLLSEYSKKISGDEIQTNAELELGMKTPEKIKNIDL